MKTKGTKPKKKPPKSWDKTSMVQNLRGTKPPYTLFTMWEPRL